MTNLRIRGKLAASFAVILGILLGIGLLSIYNQSSLNRSTVKLNEVSVPRLNALQTLAASLTLLSCDRIGAHPGRAAGRHHG